jgi:sugar lactone lactonase YvrE
VTVDSAGIVYVADTFNHTIRKITSSGVVTTLAGLANTVGSADGTGSAARFYFPYDVAVDRFGSIYAGDANCLIRKITTAGVVTTPAGLAGSVGSADGDGSAARFNYPRGVAVDIWGLVYAADTLNHTIRAIEPFDGRVRTIGGLAGMAGSADGVGGSALYKNPEGVAADRTGNIYVANTNGPTIRKITPGGQVTTFAGIAGVGGQADGPGYAAIFARPVGIAVDRTGNLYVTDYEADTIRKITSSGIVSTLAGSAFVEGSTDGTGSAARFYYPQGIAVDSSGNIFVADTLNHTIRKVTQGGIVSTFAGMAGAAGSTDGTGNAARFNNPTGISVDSSGFIYVADRLNHTVRRITSAGAVSTLAGAAGVTGSADGIGSFARFNNPCGVTVDRAGNIYVADVFNETIRKVTPGGVVTTLGGMPGTFGSSDGVGSAARFYLPFAVASDQAGNLYVADTDNETIRLGLPAVELGGSISHKVHGGAAFDVSMPRIGAPGIECRIGGAPGVHQVIMNFVKPVAIASATVTPDPLAPGAAGSVGSFSVNGGLVTLNLTNISNAQTIIITLGVTDGTYTNNVSIPMGVLAGDVSGNGSANASDISLTKSKSGQAVDATNFRADVTANGVINASDVSAVKTRSGSALP